MRECDGHVTIGVKVIGSQLKKEIVVYLSTRDKTALGEKLYCHYRNNYLSNLIFDSCYQLPTAD